MSRKPDNTFAVLNEQPAEFFKLIPQRGVNHYMIEEFPTHNAIWDMNISPEGTIFFSICGESYVAEYARLYEFDPKTKTMKHHFNLEDKIILQDRTVRTSKFHTAISFMGDGKIITTTHTTSPSPNHPIWMPYEYANHMWEGYPGSSILIYDYKTGEVQNRGVISPYDTTYGGIYVPKTGEYFCHTWMTGTGYVYNPETGEHRDLGQISDPATSRTFLCSDGHVYGSTYSGRMFRYNSDIRDIEYLDADLGDLLRHATEYKGVLYITTGPCGVPGRGQELFAYTLATGELKKLGRPVPKINYSGDRKDVFMNAYGLDVDSKGRLWYGCMTYTPEITYCGARLYMWDIQNGKDPVDLGFLGTEKRTISITAEFHIHDDVIYISDGNHICHEDGCSGILTIDINEFEKAIGTEERIYSHDYMNYVPYPLECSKYYPKDDFEEMWSKWYDRYIFVKEHKEFQAENWYKMPAKHVAAASYWETVGRENNRVNAIKWEDNENLSVYCGTEQNYKVSVVLNKNDDATTLSITECDKTLTEKIKYPVDASIKLPFMPGRQYLAEPAASEKLNDGSVIVGTKDMMLARVKDGKVFNLGAVCPCGPVIDITTVGNRVYGIAGYHKGMGNIFSYDNQTGVQLLGYVPDCFADNRRKVCIYHPTVIEASPDGKHLAIGGADELSGVIILTL